jgi:hypothetical protein
MFRNFLQEESAMQARYGINDQEWAKRNALVKLQAAYAASSMATQTQQPAQQQQSTLQNANAQFLANNTPQNTQRPSNGGVRESTPPPMKGPNDFKQRLAARFQAAGIK